jgi:hypothetical protein
MAASPIPVTIVNHVATDMAASPDTLWRTIIESFVETGRFEAAGYEIEAIDDDSTLLGGYRMRMVKDGAVVDDRICRITERDEAARRLSLRADYLSVPEGLVVYATYQAQEIAGGTRYAIDCHTQMGLAAPESGAKADVIAAVEAFRVASEAHLSGYQATLKATLEAAAG